ncbi:MAG: hypothetical protein PGN07_02870 [Aeromicrobium erythreum]
MLVVVLLAVAAVIAFMVIRDGDKVTATNAGPSSTPETPSASASPSATESTPTPKPSASPRCESSRTPVNLDGRTPDSLLPDCGTRVVTLAQEKQSGLDLGCGGRYPVILYKTTTDKSKVSVCGVDASGEKFRVVVKPNGGPVLDLKGRYSPRADAFVGESKGTEYAVLGYNGDLVITSPDGTERTQKSREWLSLDNEPDGD